MIRSLRAMARVTYRRTGLRCLWLGRHYPVRVPLGWRCASCTCALADLGDAGLGDGFVPVQRRLFSRANGGEITRTSSYEPSSRGGGQQW
jgi:hypothetical protein